MHGGCHGDAYLRCCPLATPSRAHTLAVERSVFRDALSSLSGTACRRALRRAEAQLRGDSEGDLEVGTSEDAGNDL